MDEAAIAIGGRFRAARTHAEMTLTDVAAPFNRSTQWLSKLELGESPPRADLLVAMCWVVGADPGLIVSGSDSDDSEFVTHMRELESALMRVVGGTDAVEAFAEMLLRQARTSEGRYEARKRRRERAEADADARRRQAVAGAAALPTDGETIEMPGEQPDLETGAESP